MPFGKEVSGTVLSKLYKDLTSIMNDIHNDRIQKPEKKLLHVIEEYCKKCSSGDVPLMLGNCSIDKISALQMILWNIIYYNFHEKNVCH